MTTAAPSAITGMPRIAIASPDFDGMVATFGRVLGLPVVDLSANSVASLGARLGMCTPRGGSNIELMCPADPAAPLSQSLQRFLDRRGQGLFALMLEAPEPNAAAEALKARGLNVLPLMAGAGGRDIHPNSTHGVLIRVYPVNSFQGTTSAGEHGVSGIARVLIAVRDLTAAARTYGQGLGLALDAAKVDAARGIRYVRCRPPTGGVIDLVTVSDASRPQGAAIAAFLERGEGLYGLVLQADSPVGLLAGLRSSGLQASPAPDDPAAIEIARDSAHGALVRIEPRGAV